MSDHEDAIAHLNDILEERDSDLQEARDNFDSCKVDLDRAEENLNDAQHRYDMIKHSIDVLNGQPSPKPMPLGGEIDYSLARKVIGQL